MKSNNDHKITVFKTNFYYKIINTLIDRYKDWKRLHRIYLDCKKKTRNILKIFLHIYQLGIDFWINDR